MNIEVFERVNQLAKDAETCWNEANAAYKGSHEIISAVRERIEREKTSDAKRIEELQRQASDPTRSETLKRVAAMELETLQAKTYKINDAELAVATKEISRGRQALKDLRKIPMRDTIKEAENALKELRANTLGKHDTSRIDNILDKDEEYLRKM